MDQAQIVLLCLPILALAAFATLRPRAACLTLFIGGWLFLPVTGITFRGLPDFTKVTSIQVCVLACTVFFDSGRLLALRPRWYDVPMVVLCFSPLPASLTNGLGLYDGLAVSLIQIVTFGLPYLLGRAYLADLDGLRALAIAVVVGGLLYAPLCLLEILISPQLHRIVYGFHQHKFQQAMRLGGFRPMVFMQHGLEVGMWMTAACLVGAWLLFSGSLRRIGGVPFLPILAGLFATAVLSKSSGALVLLAGGVVVLGLTRTPLAWIAVVGLALLPPAYIIGRGSGEWSARGVIDLAASVFGQDRAESLEFRMDNEDQLAARARLQPLFGWGGWGGARVLDEAGKDISITDGLWIIQFGNYGVVGVASFSLALALPLVLLLSRFRVRSWADPTLAPAAALGVLLGLWMIDNLANAHVNPIYLLAAGGLCGLSPRREIARRLDLGHDLAERGLFHQAASAWGEGLALCGAARGAAGAGMRDELEDGLAHLLAVEAAELPPAQRRP